MGHDLGRSQSSKFTVREHSDKPLRMFAFFSRDPRRWRRNTNYIIHPITMDAMLQTGTISWHWRIDSKVVTIKRVVIRAASSFAPPKAYYVRARTEPVGYGTTIISAEIYI